MFDDIFNRAASQQYGLIYVQKTLEGLVSEAIQENVGSLLQARSRFCIMIGNIYGGLSPVTFFNNPFFQILNDMNLSSMFDNVTS